MAFDEIKCEGFRWLPLTLRTLQNRWVKACTFSDVVGNGCGNHFICDFSLTIPFSLSLPTLVEFEG